MNQSEKNAGISVRLLALIIIILPLFKIEHMFFLPLL